MAPRTRPARRSSLNGRRAAIAAVLVLMPVVVLAPLLVLPSTSTRRVAPTAEAALAAWVQETLTGAQLPDAAPARNDGRRARVDGQPYWVLEGRDGCWGVPMDALSGGPRQLAARSCRRR